MKAAAGPFAEDPASSSSVKLSVIFMLEIERGPVCSGASMLIRGTLRHDECSWKVGLPSLPSPRATDP